MIALVQVLAASRGRDDTSTLITLAIYVFMTICWWVIFEKAGEAGWKAIIPIYNVIVLCRIAGWPWFAALLFLIPIVGFIAWLVLNISLARSFGRGAVFGLGLWFISIIFYPILAFGSSRYEGPGGR